MKNKRKCKNKYRPKDYEEVVNKAESAENIKPKEEVNVESFRNNSERICQKPPERKEKESKSQKRKKSDSSCPTKTQTVQEEKNSVKKKAGQAGKDSAASSVRSNPRTESADDQEKLSGKRLKPELDIKQRLKREKLRKMLQSQEAKQQESLPEIKAEMALTEEEKELKQDRSTSLRSRMEQRLESARFRYINEVLYSTSSSEAKRMFKQDPQAFWIYHKGYTAQVQRWPANPVDDIIAYIQQKWDTFPVTIRNTGQKIPVMSRVFERSILCSRPSSLVVADFGCGDCKIARSVKNRVHSFDLAATCELVTVCDMAKVSVTCPFAESQRERGSLTRVLCAGAAARRLRGHRRVLPLPHGSQPGRFSGRGQQSLDEWVKPENPVFLIKVVYEVLTGTFIVCFFS